MLEKKTKEERLVEVIKVLKKINGLGLSSENENIIELKKVLTRWVNDGMYKKGKIKLVGFDRVIYYELFNRKNVEIAINLVYNKGI